ncbi:LOB domain-containing protein 22-like [Miscanthus floridulus]|uniref:LOB domain-containing protein 22-like n=1 Tax=Miscanthus floridulus TaxID=154761 RepID=UPI003457833A
MPTPPAAQDAPTWSSSSGGVISSESASPSYSSPSDPSSSSPPAPVPSSSSAPAPSSDSRGASAPSPPPSSCAACRHQRRKCPPNCLLKHYFVADEPDKFRNALRMFGVKNLQRMLQKVPPPRRDVCVQTIVYESNLRAADPVRGCCRVIQDLENQLMDTAVELEVLRRRLESYRQMTRGSQPQPPNPLAIQQQLMARTTSDDMQDPYGVPAPPAANELTATQPQLSAMEMEPQLSPVQPQLSTTPP